MSAVPHVLVRSAGWPWASPEALASFPDLALVSADNQRTTVNRDENDAQNRVLLAAGGVHYARVLCGDDAPDLLRVELTSAELAMVLKFLTTGHLPQQIDEHVISCFRVMGLDVRSLKVTAVSAEEAPQWEPQWTSSDIPTDNSIKEEPLNYPEPKVEFSEIKVIGSQAGSRKRKIEPEQPTNIKKRGRGRPRKTPITEPPLPPGDEEWPFWYEEPEVELMPDDSDSTPSDIPEDDEDLGENLVDNWEEQGDDGNELPTGTSDKPDPEFESSMNDPEFITVHERRLEQEFSRQPNLDMDHMFQFPCDQESCAFRTDSAYDHLQHRLRHRYSKRDNGLFFFCPMCHRGYEYKDKMRAHNCDPKDVKRVEQELNRAERWTIEFQRPAPPPDQKPRHSLACTRCYFSTNDENEYKQHELRHKYSTAENGLWFFCTTCEKGFQRKEECGAHKAKEHFEQLRAKLLKETEEPKVGVRKRRSRHDLNAEIKKEEGFDDSASGGEEEREEKSSESFTPGVAVTFSAICRLCGIGFQRFSGLKAHRKKCKEFITRSAIIMGNSRTKPYVCDLCNRLYKVPCLLDKHMTTHEEGETFAECAHCGKVGTHKELEAHQSEQGQYHANRCVQCPFEFATFAEHRHHVSTEHNNVWKYGCGRCEKVFDAESTRKQHRGNCIVKRICSYCGITCQHLKRHIEMIHLPKNHKCQQCDRAFATLKLLEQHSKMHLMLHTCEKCGKRFGEKGTLRDHVIRHHTDHQDRPHRCTYCGKGFTDRGVLREHINIHTNAKPFKCPQCDYACNAKTNLHTHMKKHHNLSLYANSK